MKTWLICYAAEGRYPQQRILELQKKTIDTAIQNGVDSAVAFQRSDLDPAFVKNNAAIMSYPKGAGYWIWKPHIILKTIESPDVADGDTIIYADSKIVFIKSVLPLINVFQRDNLDVMTFRVLSRSKEWTKRDCFILTKSDKPMYTNTCQRYGGIWVFKKGEFAHHFFSTMQAYELDHRILTDSINLLGIPNYPEFQDHRHDESLVSILSKMFDLYPYRFPYPRHSLMEQETTLGEFTDESFDRYMKTERKWGGAPGLVTFRQYPDIVRDEKSTYDDVLDFA